MRTCSHAVQLAACPLSAKSGHCVSSGFVKFHQLLNWHRHDIGRSPCCRNAFVPEWSAKNLGDYGANDRCDAAIAIEDGGSRSTVVDDEAVIPLIYFKEGGTRESPVVYVLHEPATHRALLPVWIGERHDTIFRRKR